MILSVFLRLSSGTPWSADQIKLLYYSKSYWIKCIITTQKNQAEGYAHNVCSLVTYNTVVFLTCSICHSAYYHVAIGFVIISNKLLDN